MEDRSPVLCQVEAGIALLTISRPEKLNALNTETLTALEDKLNLLAENESVRVLILTGSGSKAFVAGADIGELAELGAFNSRVHALRGQTVLNRLESFPKPVIAAINGYALGGGLELAMACHIRLASENARLGQPEVGLGLIPGYGGTQRLARLVGAGHAYQLILSGRHIRADEACRIGLVNSVYPIGSLLDEARKLAATIAAQAPLAVSLGMDAIRRGLEGTLAEGLRIEVDLFALCCGSEDCAEGTRAFLEKRKAVFRGK